ncbi:MAG: tetratricopeptide repeat protein [Candidatus Omnitrophota bacterium]
MKMIAIILFIVHCSLFIVETADASEAAWRYFLKGDYKEAIEEADALESAQSHYILGLSYLKLGKPTHARKHLGFILEMYPQAIEKEEIILSIADSYFLEGDFQQAEGQYLNFLKAFPESGLNSLAYLRLGQSQRRLGKWQEAKQSLSTVINDFPNSFEKAQAQEELSKEFYYYIQVASFSREANAMKLNKAIKAKGFDSYVTKIYKDKDKFYRVCVGKIENKDDALSELKKLKANGYKAEIYP